MTATLTALRRAVAEQQAAPLELAVADWALRHGAGEPVALAMAACLRAVQEGHSCLDLTRADLDIGGAPALREALTASPLVGAPGQVRPLILERDRLYLQRYWDYETRLAARLRELLAQPPEAVDAAPLQRDGGLFDYAWVAPGQTHWQAVAAFAALRHRFCVISGGPGTGKTYTVLRLMRLLIEAALAAGRPAPRIRLAAPTGKAAARMLESVRTSLAGMALEPALAQQLPAHAQTLHRLIGIGYGSTRPRHDAGNPLAADVVIVDEASMIDLPLMTKLAEALPAAARLILLGDRYQLASVESGSVLAELCGAAGDNAFSAAQRQAAGALLPEPAAQASAHPMADHVVTLRTSHRFQADSPIGRLAAAVNAGDADAARDIARAAEPVRWLAPDAMPALLDELVAHYRQLADCREAEAALALLGQRALLCALRQGPAGSQTWNRRIAEALAQQGGFDPGRSWYHGRPVIVTRNDYRAGLYNGDIGICLRDAQDQLRVWFVTEAGLRAYLPTALPEHDTVYAMTVHKSQGSEFERVSLLLPERDNPVLSRELVYTGLTRARTRLDICAGDESWHTAIGRRTLRDAGLALRLEGGS